jgi:hypothetical protein
MTPHDLSNLPNLVIPGGLVVVLLLQALNFWTSQKTSARLRESESTVMTTERCAILHQPARERLERVEADVREIKTDIRQQQIALKAEIMAEVIELRKTTNEIFEMVYELKGRSEREHN